MPDTYCVYRVTGTGRRYVSRSVTHSRKLAEEIAENQSRGEVVAPVGAIVRVTACPYIARLIGTSRPDQFSCVPTNSQPGQSRPEGTRR